MSERVRGLKRQLAAIRVQRQQLKTDELAVRDAVRLCPKQALSIEEDT